MRGGPGTNWIYGAMSGLLVMGVINAMDIMYLFAVATNAGGAAGVYSWLTIAAALLDIVVALVGMRYAHNRYKSRLLEGFAVSLVALQAVRLPFCLLAGAVPVMLVEVGCAVIFLVGARRNRIPHDEEPEDDL